MTAPDLTYSPPSSDLTELVVAAVDGSRSAWNVLVERFSPLVTALTRRFGLNHSDAEDVAQTVWLRLVEHLARLREPRALPGWIATTTRNESLRVLSAQNRVDLVDPQTDARLDTTTSDDDVAMNLLLAERRQAVNAGLEVLRAPQRELLLLTVADPPMSYRQISQRLNMPTGSIGPIRARCLKNLKITPPLRALAS